jgi:hypothetical protein
MPPLEHQTLGEAKLRLGLGLHVLLLHYILPIPLRDLNGLLLLHAASVLSVAPALELSSVGIHARLGIRVGGLYPLYVEEVSCLLFLIYLCVVLNRSKPLSSLVKYRLKSLF